MLLSDIAKIVSGEFRGEDHAFTSVSIDSRTLKAGDLFIAIQGENFDGHAFVADAKAAGAIGAIVAQPLTLDLPHIIVADPLHALVKLATYHRQQFTIPIIALTGSCGKTTTKEMIAAILRQAGEVLATQGNLNTDIGVALTLLKLNAQHQFVVLEMGANHPGEIANTVMQAQPLAAALVNNVHPAHLAGFGSIEGVAKAKGEIYQGLAKEGVAIVNDDDAFAPLWRDQLQGQKTLTFSLTKAADFTVQHLAMDEHGHASFLLRTPAGEIAVKLPIPGQHNVANALAAAAACFAIGISLQAIQQGLQQVPKVNGRLIRKAGLAGASIIDDTYNANLGSVTAALQLLATLSQQRIFVLGDLAELGSATEGHHTEIGKLAKKLGIDALFTCGKFSRLTFDAFAGRGEHFATQQELIAALQPLLDHNTVVLVKGSRSARMENVVSALLADKN